MHSRRGFLGMLGAAAAGFALDPERALWTPGARLISIPRPAYSPTWYAAEAQRALNRALSEQIELFTLQRFLPKIGNRLSVRRPARFVSF